MKKMLLGILLIGCVVLAGCDPEEEVLKKGATLDIERIEGTVLSKEIRYYAGDMHHTKELKGDSYYCTIIQQVARGYATNVEYLGIPVEVFDALDEGMKLPPKILILSLKDLTKMEGEIIDMRAYLHLDQFFIVVSDVDKINVYMVGKRAYYKLLHIGLDLPIEVND